MADELGHRKLNRKRKSGICWTSFVDVGGPKAMIVEQERLEKKPDQINASGQVRTAELRPRRRWLLVLLLLAAVVLIVMGAILPRVRARAALRTETNELAVPTVIVVQPKPSAPGQEIVLPANVQAWKDAPIYARTNGYLKRWYVDIGARVKTGQLIAEIDTPEVNQQLSQARADLDTAQANLKLSQITASRYEGLLKSDSVSQQDADNAAGDLAAKKAIVESSQANVKRLQDLESFQRIYAPFNGVITNRNTDIGQLIDSGSSTRAELFHISDPSMLRVYVNVPQVYSQAAKPGLKADLVFQEFPGRRFQGTLVRTAEAIDQASRTLLVEIQVNNPTGEIFSGAYSEIHLKLPGNVATYTLPANALLFRSEGLQVANVKDGKTDLIPITVGRDYGASVEVLSGLTGDEKIILNPSDSIVSGQPVHISQSNANAGSAGK
jgi:RND family efflux transporter MFP subunit